MAVGFAVEWTRSARRLRRGHANALPRSQPPATRLLYDNTLLLHSNGLLGTGPAARLPLPLRTLSLRQLGLRLSLPPLPLSEAPLLGCDTRLPRLQGASALARRLGALCIRRFGGFLLSSQAAGAALELPLPLPHPGALLLRPLALLLAGNRTARELPLAGRRVLERPLLPLGEGGLL